MFPKTGNKLQDPLSRRYALAIAGALQSELGQTHRAAKTVMRWTGASERTAKNWLGGVLGPSGCHLIMLARQSDAVAAAIMSLAGRDRMVVTTELRATRAALATAIRSLDQVLGESGGDAT